MMCRSRQVTVDALKVIVQYGPELFEEVNEENETPIHLLVKCSTVTDEMIKLLVKCAPDTIGMESEVRSIL